MTDEECDCVCVPMCVCVSMCLRERETSRGQKGPAGLKLNPGARSFINGRILMTLVCVCAPACVCVCMCKGGLELWCVCECV